MTSIGEQGCYKPRGVKVPPLSQTKIRNVAMGLRGFLGETSDYIEVVDLLEFKLFKMGVDYHYCEPHELEEGIAAKALTAEGIILIRQDIYDRACNGDGMARFTIGHELGHIALHRPELIGLARGTPTGRQFHKVFEDSEWQADVFAAELLMPAYTIVRECMTASEIQQVFGVSAKAAEIRINNLRKQGFTV